MNFQPILPGTNNSNRTSPPPEEEKDLSDLFQESVSVGSGSQRLVRPALVIVVPDLPQPPIAPSCQMPRAQCSLDLQKVVEIRPSQKSVWDALVKNPQDCQGVVELNLRGCEFLTEGDIQKLGLFPNLKRLNLSCNRKLDGDWLNVNHLCRLEVLRLGGCRKISDQHLDQIIPQLTRLKELDLSGNRQLKGFSAVDIDAVERRKDASLDGHRELRGWGASLGKLTQLQVLNLCFCTSLQDIDLYRDGVFTLQRLNLKGCQNLSKASLASLEGLSSLEALDLTGCRKLGEKDLIGILQTLKGLEDLVVDDCNISDAVLSSLRALPILRFLSLSNGDKITENGIAALDQLKGLKSLRCFQVNVLGSEGGMKALESLKGLTHLSLHECGEPGNSLEHLAGLENLVSLFLSTYKGLSDGNLTGLLPKLKKLQHLDVGCCNNIKGAFFSALGALKDLKSLDVSGCTYLQLDAGQLNQLGRCKELKSLSFAGCKFVIGGVFKTLKELPKLEYVDFTECRGFTLTNGAVEHILQCQNLKRISIGGTNPIEEGALQRLKEGLPQLQIEGI